MKAGRRATRVVVLAALLLFFIPAYAVPSGQKKSDASIDVTGFLSGSPETYFDDWKIRTASSIPEHTTYRLAADEQRNLVIEATAEQSFAGLSRELSADPSSYQYIVWSWKVSDIVESADLAKKEADDAPVRLMVSFGRNLLKGGIPEGSLCYVWSKNDAVGSFVESPYTSEVMAVVVASGSDGIGIWQHYRRNLVDDYRRAFGADPGTIRAITLISDTDNTKARLNAWYGAITLEKGTDTN